MFELFDSISDRLEMWWNSGSWAKRVFALMFFSVLLATEFLFSVMILWMYSGLLALLGSHLSIMIAGCAVVALHAVYHDNSDRADKLQALILLMGFLGTAIGMNDFLKTFRPGVQDFSALRYAFSTTVVGIGAAVVISAAEIVLNRNKRDPEKPRELLVVRTVRSEEYEER